jgi:hypothetical protein
MENELYDVKSPIFEKKQIGHILDSLSVITTEAIDLRNEEFVDNPELQNALLLVEEFLRKKKRVCYGGMAINAHLPLSLKFYNFSKTLPDYDFFTPESEKDVKELKQMFKINGYKEVDARLGIHPGTTKLYVNFVSVADITSLPVWLYSILKKRSIDEKGIQYVDADFLRMNMYLELSRPRGEVERWKKVYERLLLLNSSKKTFSSKCKPLQKNKKIVINKNLHETFIKYISHNRLIFAGAELKRVYSNTSTRNAGYILKSQSPVLAYAKSPEFHIPILKTIVKDDDPSATVKILHWSAIGDDYPEMWGIAKNGVPIFICIDEIFCNSYNIVNLPNNMPLHIVSLDAAITLFFMLTFLRGLEGIVPTSIHCFANSLVDISHKTRDTGNSGVYPLFVLECHGHQESKASLMREKLKRIKSLKKKKINSVNLETSETLTNSVLTQKTVSKTQKRKNL